MKSLALSIGIFLLGLSAVAQASWAPPVSVPGATIAYSGTPAKFVLADNNVEKILVINTAGEVWAQWWGGTVSSAVQYPGASVGVSGTPASFAAYEDDKIYIINTAGEVWVHHITCTGGGCPGVGGSFSIDAPYQIPGFPVAALGAPAVNVQIKNSKFYVFNNVNEVWVHDITDKIGTPYMLSGTYPTSSFYMIDGGAWTDTPGIIETCESASSALCEQMFSKSNALLPPSPMPGSNPFAGLAYGVNYVMFCGDNTLLIIDGAGKLRTANWV